MILRTALFCLLAISFHGRAVAAPNVAVDIAPVHSLVAQVMEGVGEPDLILPPGSSPHGYSMRPSEAASVQRADVVFWVDAALTPWMARSLGNLADGAEVVMLSEAEGLIRRDRRSDEAFGDHDHDHGHSDDHGDDHADDHGKDGSFDPHIWLDPVNGQVILAHIADVLSRVDPSNAAVYRANADVATKAIKGLMADIEVSLEPVKGKGFMVFHDAYHYFEARFGIEASGAIALSDAATPGARKLQQVRDRLREQSIVCLFAEPQFDTKLVETVREGSSAKTGLLDPLGADLPTGPTLYAALIRRMGQGFADCLG